jgi:6-phosphogluconolactonase (cycloisomerase 2 family)
MKRLFRSTIPLVALIVGFAFAVPAASASNGYGGSHHAVGAVYTMTNDSSGNAVVVFARDAAGALEMKDTVPTGGIGSGGGVDPLASQNSLVLSENGRWLLAVNAGSNDISVFQVTSHGLELTDRVDSGGTMPVSLAIHSNRVYVLNAGETANISGFTLSRGELRPIPDSTRELGSGSFSQVGFDRPGRKLIITDKGDNELLVYKLRWRGVPSDNPVVTPSSGLTPFGFVVENSGRLLVVEVNGGNGAVSSYRIGADGRLHVLSASVTNGQAASCWIASDDRGNVYTTNPGSSSISSYDATRRGRVTLVDATAATGVATLDEGVSQDGRFLYALNPGNGGIETFRIGHDGSLTSLGFTDGGLATYTQGLAVR